MTHTPQPTLTSLSSPLDYTNFRAVLQTNPRFLRGHVSPRGSSSASQLAQLQSLSLFKCFREGDALVTGPQSTDADTGFGIRDGEALRPSHGGTPLTFRGLPHRVGPNSRSVCNCRATTQRLPLSEGWPRHSFPKTSLLQVRRGQQPEVIVVKLPAALHYHREYNHSPRTIAHDYSHRRSSSQQGDMQAKQALQRIKPIGSCASTHPCVSTYIGNPNDSARYQSVTETVLPA